MKLSDKNAMPHEWEEFDDEVVLVLVNINQPAGSSRSSNKMVNCDLRIHSSTPNPRSRAQDQR
jgi:hypothetical protein